MDEKIDVLHNNIEFLSLAVELFDCEKSGIPDFERVRNEVAERDAPAPFSIVRFDNDPEDTKQCPEWDHDCIREGCGRSFTRGGEIGVRLIDANGVCWRECGIRTQASYGF